MKAVKDNVKDVAHDVEIIVIADINRRLKELEGKDGVDSVIAFELGIMKTKIIIDIDDYVVARMMKAAGKGSDSE